MFKRGLSTSYPAYIIIIVDQSLSMNNIYCDGKTKAEFATNYINQFISELILANNVGDRIADRIFITLLGCSNGLIKDLGSEYLSGFYETPLRREKVKKKISNGAGGLVEIEVEKSIYLEPNAKGNECLFEAFDFARQLIDGWLNKKKYPSVMILNIYGGVSLPKKWEEITSCINYIKTKQLDGETPHIFNIILDKNNVDYEFPSLAEIYNQSFTTQLFYEWSTYVSNEIIELGKGKWIKMKPNAKCFFNSLNNQYFNFNTGS